MIFSKNRHPSPDQVRGQAFSGSCSGGFAKHRASVPHMRAEFAAVRIVPAEMAPARMNTPPPKLAFSLASTEHGAMIVNRFDELAPGQFQFRRRPSVARA
jgi:hypothetical protein